MAEIEAPAVELFPWKIQGHDSQDDYNPSLEIGPGNGKLYLQIGKIELKITQHPENGSVEIEAYDKETCTQELGDLILFQRDVED